MLYLVLKRDLEKISLARKHVLSDRELPEARRTIWLIVSVAVDRIESLKSRSESPVSRLRIDSPSQALFYNKTLKLRISLRSLQRVWYVRPCSVPGKTRFIGPMKYNFCSSHGPAFEEDQFQELTTPIPCRDEVIPDPGSISLSILNHPTGKRHEINFAAYDPPEFTTSHTEEVHPG